jgi:hypothetical protein
MRNVTYNNYVIRYSPDDFDSLPACHLDWEAQGQVLRGNAKIRAFSFHVGLIAEAAANSQVKQDLSISERAIAKIRKVIGSGIDEWDDDEFELGADGQFIEIINAT